MTNSLAIFLYGLVFSSFYNVIGMRVPAGKSILYPPSTCTHCQYRLTFADLLPLISYILLRGRCRKCKKSISPLYFIMELVTPLLFVFAYQTFGWSLSFLYAFLLISLLSILIVSDLVYMLIPNKLLLVFGSIIFPIWLIKPLESWGNSLLAAFFTFGVLAVFAMLSKGGIGGGDIKLFALLGFILGFKLILLAFFLACFFGAVISLILLFFGIIKRKEPVPFAPFISMGTLLAYFKGNIFIDWYLSFF
ncbi:prepilin peptidase [Domibacillus sp. 8LH]|uniref:prepilin peptidase n=1 Tax=Domibacillus sp. 8LH TaxID=3073900 RepID=UPI003173AB81